MPVAFKGNYLSDFSAALVLALGSGATVSTNLTLTNATSSISGQLVDANNSGIALPGIFMSANANSGLMGWVLRTPTEITLWASNRALASWGFPSMTRA